MGVITEFLKSYCNNISTMHYYACRMINDKMGKRITTKKEDKNNDVNSKYECRNSDTRHQNKICTSSRDALRASMEQ